MNRLASLNDLEAAFAQLREIIPGLPDEASLNLHCCWSCVRCQEAYGFKPFYERGATFGARGGYHIELQFTDTPRVLGGQTASAIGRDSEEAWDNLLRALA